MQTSPWCRPGQSGRCPSQTPPAGRERRYTQMLDQVIYKRRLSSGLHFLWLLVRHVWSLDAPPPSPSLLTAILAWKSAVGTMGMGPPCFPNFLSKLSCTDTTEKSRRVHSSSRKRSRPRLRTGQSLHSQSGLEPSSGLVGPSSCSS